jgi:Trypsin-like peptidase domain/Tetratricopeptide repeat
LVMVCPLAVAVADSANIPALVQKAKPVLKTGTGFFISPDGELLTNYHVISGGSSITAKMPNGALFILKSIVTASESYDVAKLQFVATGVPYLTLGSSSSAVEGQRILVIGNPEGLEGTVSDGIISAFRAGRTMIQITAPVSPGSSGSPVLDESGNVIGIATQALKEGQNLNFAISAETVRDAIAKSAIVAPVPTPFAALTPTPSVAASAANDYFHRAVQEATNGNHQGAIADFTEGIRLQPDNSLAYVLRGETYNSLQQYDKAINDFTESIRLNPNAGPTYCDRGNSYLCLKQYRKAINDYTEAIRLESQFEPDGVLDILVNPYEGRAFVYEHLGNHSKAAQDRKKAKELRGR